MRDLCDRWHCTPTYVTCELPVTVLIGLSEGSGGMTREEALARHRERLRERGLLPEGES